MDIDSYKLFEYVRKDDIPKAVNILVEKDANPNDYNDSSGDTALHAAVRNHNVSLVKLLILFDADLQVVNKQGETPYDLALMLGAKECAQAIESILLPQQQLAKDGPKIGEIRSPPTKDDDNINLLCLDGGGIKGLVLIEVMLQIEKRCKQLYGSQLEQQHTNFLSYFNWIGGNSTGGLCALAIACGKTPKEGRKLYFHLKSKILTHNPPYPRELVDEHYQQIYGATKTMSEIKDRNVTIMTTTAKTNPPKLHIMSNYMVNRVMACLGRKNGVYGRQQGLLLPPCHFFTPTTSSWMADLLLTTPRLTLLLTYAARGKEMPMSRLYFPWAVAMKLQVRLTSLTSSHCKKRRTRPSRSVESRF